jgi:ABC-type antimicrobial peptide transport system permease subunit
VSFDVARRMQEVGVRIALGAGRRDVLRTVMTEGLRLVAIGLAIGLIAAFALGGALASMLIGVRPSDPLTYLAIVVIFSGVALVATWGPARRAATADPVLLLRDE